MRQVNLDKAYEVFEAGVREFMTAFGQDTPDKPIMPSDQVKLLRRNLIIEELKETKTALEKNDPIEFMDGLSDTVVVTSGTLIAYGLQHKPTFPWNFGSFVPKNIEKVQLLDSERLFQLDKIQYFIDNYPLNDNSSYYGRFLSMYCIELIATCVHMAACHGCDLVDFFKEVHASNMSKLGADGKPIYRESDRKVLKGPNFRKPDIASVWQKQIELSKA